MDHDANCFYCAKDDRLSMLMVPLCSLEHADVYILRDQKHPGRCVVAARRHAKEIYDFTTEERNGFFADVTAVAKAIACAYGPAKLNYAVYGDLVPHFHVHLVPKTQNGLRWGEPFNDTDSRQPATQAELEGTRQKLMRHLP